MRNAHNPDDVALDGISEIGVGDVAQRKKIAIAEGKKEENNPPPPALPLLAPDVADVGDAAPCAAHPHLDVADVSDAVPHAAINRRDAVPREVIDIAEEEEEENNPPLSAPPLLDLAVAETSASQDTML